LATLVASAVISLGQTLNFRVIAEGVKTEAQAALLRNLNCDEMKAKLVDGDGHRPARTARSRRRLNHDRRALPSIP
jgi:EAL domain-containing protein (putative c-di-GMP-specific phosphodiesterase class I)